ncbi:MAG: hypothetical protein HOP12_08810 [Candidatus Eisenbacteria bacterium]|uniref:SGNH hydrolase-type esterase domain-containing protein n=1 Tax=Eiseniibacteriota bacterium TaxID=2212470 RepID=A0A849SKM6_UNCEI|nr:hypothetical protein [Candidatus Eisenbacteria bacterium]
MNSAVRIRAAAALAFLLVLGPRALSTGIAHADPGTARRLVVLGSSTALGAGASTPDSAWVKRFEVALTALNPDHQLVNLATLGSTGYHLRPTGTSPPAGRPSPDTAHNITAALALDPDAIVISLSGDDVASGFASWEQIASFDSLLDRADAARVPVWVATPQPRDLAPAARDSLAAMRDYTFAKFGSKALDFWTSLATASGSIDPAYGSGDGVNPNDAGHRLLFDRVLAAGIVVASPPPGTDTTRHIVVLGSSTAAGIGPSHPDSAWVNRYRAAVQQIFPGHQVTNLAVGGFTTYHVQPTGFVAPAGRPSPDPTHNITTALGLAPDLLIINLPSNDAANGYTLAEQFENYERVVALAELAEVPVWVTTTQPRDLSAAARESLMVVRDWTLTRFGTRAIDFWSTVANPDGTIDSGYSAGDGIHLNDGAHQLLFERVMAESLVTAPVVGVPTPRAPAGPALHLLSVGPNPARGRVRFEFVLDRPESVELLLYDVRGRLRDSTGFGRLPVGRHAQWLAVDGLPSGIYFALVRTSHGSTARRVALVR